MRCARCPTGRQAVGRWLKRRRLIKLITSSHYRDQTMITSHTASNDTFQTAAVNPHLFELGNHLRECEQARGRLFSIYRLSERIQQLIAPRLYTTVLAGSALIYLALVWT
jgi:hypothetical protein